MKKILTFMILLHFFGCAKSQDLLIRNAKIINVEDGTISENSSILISNGIITKISTDNIDSLNVTYRLINADGKYVIPGLIDGHVHTTSLPESQSINALQKTLRGGVTSIRDMGGDGILIKEWQMHQEELKIPTILSTSILAGSSWMNHDFRAKASAHGEAVGTSPWLKSVDKLEDIDIAVEMAKSYPVNGLKVYADISEDLLIAIVEEAKRRNIPVYSHATIYPTGPKEVVSAGVDVISHVERILTVLDSSIAPNYASDRTKNKVYTIDQLNDPRIEEILRIMSEKEIALDATLLISKIRGNQLGTTKTILPTVYGLTKKAYLTGVPIIAGTDQMINPSLEHPNLHEELRLLVEECELNPLEAIQSATIIPAKYFRLANLGQVKKGYVADLILLDMNPLEDIKNTTTVYKVIKHGKIID